MRFLLVAALAIFSSACAEEKIDPDHDYVYIPDDAGNLWLVDLLAKGEDLTGFSTGDSTQARNLDTITFQLYTVDNPTVPDNLFLNSIESVKNSHFLSSRPTRFITHGWRSSQRSKSVVEPREAYLDEGDYNVITVDWSPIANNIYVSVAPSVSGVASRVAEMLDFLHDNAGLDFSTTHLVGHSLGGHIVGLAARFAKGTIKSVIALDPALPLFERAKPGQRVDASDAYHVQVIHTNGGLLGMMEPVGDTDFYPNGGRSQPGCGSDRAGLCAHSRAYLFFAESIRNPTGFQATGEFSVQVDKPKRIPVFMGGRRLSTLARGSFTLITADKSPFALG